MYANSWQTLGVWVKAFPVIEVWNKSDLLEPDAREVWPKWPRGVTRFR